MDFTAALCREFPVNETQVRNTVRLLDEGNTIPFIARYRKELTGSLDDQTLRALAERLDYLRALEKRRGDIAAQLEELGALTHELQTALAAADTLAELEDLYRPYRPKRKTRASAARERGLAPLAELIFAQPPDSPPPETLAVPFVDAEKGVSTPADAVQGALDIIAEQLSDDADIRRRLRTLYQTQGVLRTSAAKQEDSVYSPYYDYAEAVSKIVPHRILAVNRGEVEEYLRVCVALDPARALAVLESAALRPGSACTAAVRAAAADAYDRLLRPSLERETRAGLTERAQEAAIRVFADNLRQLLMQPPVKGKTVLGLDPAYRTGCKVAVVDPTGKVLETGVVYPTPPHNRTEEAARTLTRMIEAHGVEVISIGNGTASRETERFAAELIARLSQPVAYAVVSEAGASVYSASKVAAEEFPQFDVSLRSAVSIARRLQDPLAELVKIDPKAIGVGQYQHDMPQKRLSEALDGVVEDCVNAVGADLNTASAPLLAHIAGISAALAKSIVAYREEHGAFMGRAQLKKVPKLGPKAFEQCAGFLRVPGGENVLDRTAVHPESYAAAELLLTLCGYTPADAASGRIGELSERIAALGEAECARRIGVGAPTLRDMAAALAKPGRDPRDELPPPVLRTDVLDIKDPSPGMELSGTVRNVVDFGAFIDIGVHQDGLVHISQICSRYLRHPSEALKVGDIVRVRVLSVDTAKQRISLTMREDGAGSEKAR